VQLVSKISNLCGPGPPSSQTDGQTEGRTTCNRNTVHRAVKSLIILDQRLSVTVHFPV